jgi:C-terminal region of MMR_HSR1 domain
MLGRLPSLSNKLSLPFYISQITVRTFFVITYPDIISTFEIPLQLNTTVKLTKMDEKTVRTVLAGYKIHNCDVMIREDVRNFKVFSP